MNISSYSQRALATFAVLAVLSACSDPATAPAAAVGIRAARDAAVAITVTDLGPNVGANAVNARGMIVGVGANGHATIWWHGMATDLGTLGGGRSVATGISATGDVVGMSVTTAGDEHAFLWRGGVMIDLGTLGGNYSAAAAINPSDLVVGTSTTASGAQHAFLWAGGVMQDLGTLGGANSHAYDVSPSGRVVGYSDVTTPYRFTHAFLWQGGVMTDIGDMVGPSNAASAINASGLVAGTDVDPRNVGDRRLIFWRGTSASYSGFENDHLFVNDLALDGSVVGSMEGLPYGLDEPFLWKDGTRTILLPPPGVPGPQLYGSAVGIDPLGHFIVGWVRSPASSYGQHALLWTVGTGHGP